MVFPPHQNQKPLILGVAHSISRSLECVLAFEGSHSHFDAFEEHLLQMQKHIFVYTYILYIYMYVFIYIYVCSRYIGSR